ncbi:MAG: ATPase [Bacteroidetes bacterium]|nr:ATPase [Bacteroidota bacterium]
MKYTNYFYLIAFLAFNLHASTQAAVADSSSYGFTIKFERLVKIQPDSLYNYLVRDIGQWWNPDHTWSGKATNLSIQPVANGCFCETLENKGSVRHMTVIFVDPGKTLRLEGGLGPLQMLAVAGVLTFEISLDKSMTKINLSYSVGGYIPGGTRKWAPLVNQVLGEQFTRLVDYAEKK